MPRRCRSIAEPQPQQMRHSSGVGVREPVPYEQLEVGVPKETFENERRVALTPQGVAALLKAGFRAVRIERGAGAAAQFTVRTMPVSCVLGRHAAVCGVRRLWRALPPFSSEGSSCRQCLTYHSLQDEEYTAAGAQIVRTDEALAADIVLKIRPPDVQSEVAKLKAGGVLVSYIQPAVNEGVVAALRERDVTVIGARWLLVLRLRTCAPRFQSAWMLAGGQRRGWSRAGMDCIPRTLSRAQTFDSLSSMANIAGYRAVVEAATHFPRFFTGQITAAGRVPPAKVLVIGGGVAGLAAVGTAKNMGAVVCPTRGCALHCAPSSVRHK